MKTYSELVGAGQGGWRACSKHNNSHQRPEPTSWCPFWGPGCKSVSVKVRKRQRFHRNLFAVPSRGYFGGKCNLMLFFEEIEVKEEDARRQWEKSECKNVSKCVRVSVRWRLERSLRLFVSRWSSFPPTLLSLFCSLRLQSGWWGWRYYVCSDSASVKELFHCREHFITMRILMHFSRLIPAVILDC